MAVRRRYYDTEGDGLYHFGERYYDRAGHWTQQDRISGDITQPATINRYLYVSANPVNRIDPTGQIGFDDLLATVAEAIVGGIVGVACEGLTWV